jgi:hypothetical protein
MRSSNLDVAQAQYRHVNIGQQREKSQKQNKDTLRSLLVNTTFVYVEA